MKKIAAIIGAGVLAASFAQPTKAADMDYQAAVQQLVVSGLVETWIGYTFIGSNDTDEDLDDYFNGGRSGRLSLPLGDNLSIQMDVDNETNSSWAYGGSDKYDDDFHYSWQGLGHLSFRDPSRGLVGVFGGAGTGNGEDGKLPFYVIGGEAQVYLSNITFYGQGGLLDAGLADEMKFKDAGFGRGVVRWFTSDNSRIQGEVSYISGEDEEDDLTVLEWGARYDTVLVELPILGDTNVFVGYRGARFDNSDDGKFFDHTFMVGFRSWFGGNSLLEFDRVGATLDAPNFGRWNATGL